ncbi:MULTISPECIES: right-handed parallel beta-helix repeat-containing protein [unclassified Mucilaginibacter]|uniref:right-handed parallel beta-helix repeat-containing protein n=1 Tax=unclassified Mucilaginibacter TaxID=2617802 RepID=UPI002AC94A43|nr:MULTISPECIES: right-handed parallel beta-helix repeat-containing protein [unclassified Mucilaginibacter]MEB0262076.1 right-handed parallel beta-helix repeat-containing protein [Mucilaginibacter sp. 10I4]MEB0278814.1 right-handed parallel beta-helix repeat-containing protein [Mucilaginibacter sp. 10B2]MEB0299821.1 right-handed parallel beta-helix repeat-containing protein [Mucilaginibacter sp. 5C4]WPX21996.1 right-handed parallel beta-helix repeat-containing protein [Mucilaginibacter sp. 5C4]
MKLKYSYILAANLLLAATFSACQKAELTTFNEIKIPTSSPISQGNISGFVKGTLVTGQTYTVTADITIKKGDTLSAQPGTIVIVKNNAQINVQGALMLIGSKDQPILFNSDSNKPGTWGGLQCDTAQAITIKWTHIDNTGGPDAKGEARGSLKVKKAINVDIEDSWFTNGQDDLMAISNGATVTILRNTISSSGSTDGEGINLKTGVKGVVAYNVIFSQAGSGIKLETSSKIPFPQTEVDVYNNTLISNGWRRGSAEPGRAVSVGVNAIGHIYNNIIVNCYHGIELFTDGDITKTTYGNNLFYATVDTYADLVVPTQKINIRDNFYPAGAAGKPQISDLISKKIGDKDPLFVNFDGTVAAPNGFPNNYDFRLKNSSPAFSAGNPKYNLDLGAYTSDGKGNQH